MPDADGGAYRYDFGDTARLTPLLPMYTLGHVPASVHAGGLCALVRAGLIEAHAYSQHDAFGAGLQFARTQGILPGFEPAHAVRAAVEEGLAHERRASGG